MLRFFVNYFVCLIAIIYSLSRKNYRHAYISSMVFGYFFLIFLRSSYNFLEYSALFGHLERILLLLLAVYAVVIAVRSRNRKLDIKLAVFACIACVFRYVHTVVFRVYGNLLKAPEVDAFVLHDRVYLICTIADCITGLSLLIMTFCIVWNLFSGKMVKN